MKQTIEIDVPDGYDPVITPFSDTYGNPATVLINFKKKEPEFIDVREYIAKAQCGEFYMDVLNKIQKLTPEEIESCESFVRWIDQTWRKVEI